MISLRIVLPLASFLLLGACTPMKILGWIDQSSRAFDQYMVETLSARREHRMKRRELVNRRVDQLEKEGKYEEALKFHEKHKPSAKELIIDIRKIRKELFAGG